MSTLLAELKALEAAMTAGPWGLYGPLAEGTMEAAPGQSIGSVTHTEPIARFSGYLLPAEANAQGIARLR